MRCDFCEAETGRADLFCTECGGVAHSDPGAVYGDVCGERWAVLAHADKVIGCASGCDCVIPSE